jgi:hypothetical protein
MTDVISHGQAKAERKRRAVLASLNQHGELGTLDLVRAVCGDPTSPIAKRDMMRLCETLQRAGLLSVRGGKTAAAKWRLRDAMRLCDCGTGLVCR